ERELAALQQAWNECVQERAARALLLTGPAGGGKTRLLQTFLERLRAQGSTFTLLAGRGDPMRGGTQFGVLSFALHAWAEIASGDALELKRKKLSDRLEQLAPDVLTLAHFLGEMVGVPF